MFINLVFNKCNQLVNYFIVFVVEDFANQLLVYSYLCLAPDDLDQPIGVDHCVDSIHEALCHLDLLGLHFRQ